MWKNYHYLECFFLKLKIKLHDEKLGWIFLLMQPFYIGEVGMNSPKFVWEWWRENRGLLDLVPCAVAGKKHCMFVENATGPWWTPWYLNSEMTWQGAWWTPQAHGERHKPRTCKVQHFLLFFSFPYFFRTHELCINKYLKRGTNTGIIQ